MPELIRIPFPRAGQCLRMASSDHRTKTKTDNMPVSNSSLVASYGDLHMVELFMLFLAVVQTVIMVLPLIRRKK